MQLTVADRMAMSGQTIRTYWKKGVFFWEGKSQNGIRLKLPFESEDQLALFLSTYGHSKNGKRSTSTAG